MRRGAADLNLLVVFEAIMEERSVSRAAARLGLSQPAVSHALTRLRNTFGDQLFVRSPTGMLPTPRAESLVWPVRQALAGLEAILEPERFDPATETRQMTIAANNYAAIVLVPGIVARCAAEAPNVALTVRPSGTLDVVDLMDRNEIALVLADTAQNAERTRSQLLITDDYVAVMRSAHLESTRRLTAASLSRMAHLGISSSANEEAVVDMLERAGIVRNVALRAPLLSAGAILSQSDSVAILARHVARMLCKAHGLEMRDLPFESERLTTSMLWPRRLDDQAAHIWLRKLVGDVARSIPA